MKPGVERGENGKGEEAGQQWSQAERASHGSELILGIEEISGFLSRVPLTDAHTCTHIG